MYACMTPVGFDTSDKFENHCSTQTDLNQHFNFAYFHSGSHANETFETNLRTVERLFIGRLQR